MTRKVREKREFLVAGTDRRAVHDERRARYAGWNTGKNTDPSSRASSLNATRTFIPHRTSSSAHPSMFDVSRTPSSSSTMATTYGSRSLNGGKSFWRTIVNVYTTPSPLASFHEVEDDQHRGQ